MSAKRCTNALRHNTAPLRNVWALLKKGRYIVVAYRYPERDDNKAYNAFNFIKDHGKTLADHRKTVLHIGIEHNRVTIGSRFSALRAIDAQIALVTCSEYVKARLCRLISIQNTCFKTEI